MSYCRWSTDDFQCDLYVYEDCAGGWTTHVACNRVVFARPLPPEIVLDTTSIDSFYQWCRRSQKVTEIVMASDHVKIGLPFDGCYFNDETPGQCADRLESLKEVGYRFPSEIIDELRMEETEAVAGQK